MGDRAGVLSDHKKIRSKLVTPFNNMFGPIHEVSWANTIIPELLWIALLHDAHGHRRAVQIVTVFTRSIRAHSPNLYRTIWAAAGKYSKLSDVVLEQAINSLDTNTANDLRGALSLLAACYPSNPLMRSYNTVNLAVDPTMVTHLRMIVHRMYDRSDQFTMMVQANAIWIAFDSHMLKVGPNDSLAKFPSIQHYPETELSRRIAASIRSTLNLMFADQQMMASDGEWPIYFWNHGLQLQACELRDG